MLRLLKRFWLARRARRDRQSLTHEPSGPALLTHNPQHIIYVREYYRYCVSLFRDALKRNPQAMQLVFGDYPACGASMPVRHITFQIEHTIVKPGGGDSEGAPESRTRMRSADGYYLARLLHRPRLVQADLIVDYSSANIRHLQAAGGFDDVLPRMIAIAPLLHARNFSAERRDVPVLTLFSNPDEGRRAALLKDARSRRLPVRNRKRCFDGEALQTCYGRSRILLNVRRTEHHDTIEELRILPALMSGVIVVSEDGPLRDCLPYARYVVWADYERLLDQCTEVLREYEVWHERLFGDQTLITLLERMEAQNVDLVEKALAAWSAGRDVAF